jgi:predicted nucleic acid-binding protein
VMSLARQGHVLGLCCINVAELYSGLSQQEEARAERLVDSLDYYVVTRETAKEAGGHRHNFARRGITLATADALIAAAAIKEGATLITANVKDFPLEELQLMEHS